jgi:hypothetical protein
MRRALLVASLPLAVLACSTEAPRPDPSTKAPSTTQAATPKPAVVLGAPIGAGPSVALSEIASHAGSYENKVVTTSGTVTAVCQHMGCWMELKDDSGKGEAHVKMAGHEFFVPKTASGRHARVQAKVLKTDPSEECSQEASEQTGKPVAKLELEATGVELD